MSARSSHRKTVLVMLTALTIAAFAASASSALAVSVEPLNKKFSGTSTNMEFKVRAGGIQIICKKTTFEGTSQSTKANFVTMTPVFSECEYLPPHGVSVTVKQSCSNGLKLTFSEGGVGTTSITCLLSVEFPDEVCTVKVAPGKPVTGATTWSNLSPESLKVGWSVVFEEAVATPEVSCEKEVLFTHELLMKGEVKLKGVQVH